MRSPTGQPRDAGLDSLRAVAALSILTFHVFTIGLAQHGIASPWDRIVSRLDVGVPVFFVLSGFLIYRPFVISGSRARPAVSTYAVRRFLRLVPAYWVALAFASGAAHPWRIFEPHQLRYTFFAQIYSEDSVFGGISAAWSLCTEVTFYAMVPLLGWLLIRARVRTMGRELMVIAALAAVSLVARPVLWSSGHDGFATALLVTNLMWFSLGMALAVVKAHPRGPELARLRQLRPTWAWLAAGGLFALACVTVPQGFEPRSAGEDELRFVLYGAIAALVVTPVAVREKHDPGRWLNSRPLVALGLISYGIFLYHMPLMGTFDELAHQPSTLAHIGFVAAVLAGSVVAGAVSYVLIERPLQLLSHRRRETAGRPIHARLAADRRESSVTAGSPLTGSATDSR